MMPIIIYIFNIIHNIQLGYDYNYVHLITYIHHVAKLRIPKLQIYCAINGDTFCLLFFKNHS